MGRYLIRRVLLGLLSAAATTALVMGILYSVMDRNMVFASDPVYRKLSGNQRIVYQYSVWEDYGYLDYVPYTDYLEEKVRAGDLSAQEREKAGIGLAAQEDSPEAAAWTRAFTEEYEKKGYTVRRLEGSQAQLFAFRDHNIPEMVLRYFAGILQFDYPGRVQGDIGDRGLTFTLYDPVYGGERFSPAIIGNGTLHRYLFYIDSRFPWVHQNFLTVRLGKSVSVNRGEDVVETMFDAQGTLSMSDTLYPSGYREMSADDLHTAVYVEGSAGASAFNSARFTDDYTLVGTRKTGMSRTGYSFLIGVIAVLLSYLLALPLSTWMAMHEGSAGDLAGTAFAAFITAVPALAYIFLFKEIGRAVGLPVTFSLEGTSAAMFVMPVISIALPAAGRLMKWNRRYANDQMEEEYVRFARACGFSGREVLFSHVMRNAAIPIVQGIPASILGALTGAVITERVYLVPGAGGLLTTAISAYDNSVIVGLALFYALITVLSGILGDLLMAAADPRVSLTGTGE